MSNKADIVIDPQALKAATEAFYNAQLEQARVVVSKRTTAIDDMPSLFARIYAETETAQILIFGSYLEDRFRSALEENLLNMDEADADERLFGSFGPLSSFSARILIAYHLGWLSKMTRSRLDAFRRVRNEFAHNAFRTSFAAHSVAQNMKRMAGDEREYVEKIHKTYVSAAPDQHLADRELNSSGWTLVHLAVLAGRVIEELLVLPAARDAQVNPQDLLRLVRSAQRSTGPTGAIVRTILEMYARMDPSLPERQA